MVDLASANVQVDSFVGGGVGNHHVVLRSRAFLLDVSLLIQNRRHTVESLSEQLPAHWVWSLVGVKDCDAFLWESSRNQQHHQPSVNRNVVAEHQVPTVRLLQNKVTNL